VISAGVRDDAVRRFLVCEGENGIRRAAYFERARFLEIFAFEKEPGAGDGVERCTGQRGRAVDARGDAGVGLLNCLPGRRRVSGLFGWFWSSHESDSFEELDSPVPGKSV